MRSADDVLVVEDDHELREVLLDTLRSRGYRAHGVSNGVLALEYLQTANPALILLDLIMPGMDGWRFRVEQKKLPQQADTAVIAISGSDRPEAAAIDASGYFEKPFDLDELMWTVDRVINDAQSKRLARTERLISLGTLAAGVAHEINNPLAYVIANLEHLLDVTNHEAATDSDEDVNAVLQETLDGAWRIRDVVQQVRFFSHAGADEHKLSGIDVHESINGALRIIHNQIRHRARLVKNYGNVSPVLASDVQLGQVFLNLLSNAAQAIPHGDSAAHAIVITTEQPSRESVSVTIADSGCGIPEEVKERIFEPFFTTKAAVAGTGLGLAICRGLIRAWGGDITVRSEANKGAAFTVTLRRAQRVTTSTTPPPIAKMTRGYRPRVLIIDDEPIVARAIRRRLSPDYEVTITLSGEAALEILDKDAGFDAILCDLSMPTLSGPEVFEALRARQPSLEQRVVFMSGGVLDESVQQFIEGIPNPCFEKPIDFVKLDQALGRLRRPPAHCI